MRILTYQALPIMRRVAYTYTNCVKLHRTVPQLIENTESVRAESNVRVSKFFKLRSQAHLVFRFDCFL
jgi:hypothetical protein